MMISKANRLPLSRSARWRSCFIRHYPGARGLLLVAILSLSGCGQYLDKHDTERLTPAHQTEYAEGSLPLTLRPDEYPKPAPLLLTVQQKRALGDVIGWGRFPAKINPAELIAQQLARSWQKVIAAQRGYPSAEQLQALLAQAPLLTTQEQKQKNSDVIWEVLTSLSQEDINALSSDRQADALQGWLALRRIWSDSRAIGGNMAHDIATWQARRSRSPDAFTRPHAQVSDAVSRPAAIRQIAVILPLSGQAGRFGRAIRHGLEAQKNTAGWQSGPVPNLRFYDTSVAPVTTLLAKAEKDGTSLVVGPLLKPHVRDVLNSHTTLNILALNLPEDPVSRDNLCYFSLSPEDEARSAARHIYGQNKHLPLLLLPQGELGRRVADAFQTEWEKLRGKKVLVHYFGPVSTLKAAVNSGKGISLVGSRAGKATPPYPSQDVSPREERVDAVYMTATPVEALYLRALIVMRNGSNAGTMLYASSRSISGRKDADERLEMEGLQFSEIPLMSGQDLKMRQRALDATRGDYVLGRLYAMGADAWMLAAHFAQLHQAPGMVLKGHTGELSVTTDCVITRSLHWFSYRDGQVVPVS
ncbi:penicillin-binding protein activator [Enterobacter asburiae]|uniref:penicillin-binding protein activator n=1 Tax=Enterobacter asburiae TaxID=61645 RepID=UPI0021D2301E|nr:penicillin-binding protein activator [Enterobacter asburiae]